MTLSKRLLIGAVAVGAAIGLGGCGQFHPSSQSVIESGLPAAQPTAAQPAAAAPPAAAFGAFPIGAGDIVAAATTTTTLPNSPPLGENPIVQRVLKAFAGPEQRFQNALFDAEATINAQSTDTTTCQTLADAAGRILAATTTPSAALNKFLDSGIADLQQAGNACVSGDFATAASLIGQGVSARAAAQNLIDEILEGSAGQ